MGLDVYLYKYENYEETHRKETEYETISEANWNEAGSDYDSITDVQKESVRNKNKNAASQLGLNEDGADRGNYTKIEIDSKTDPKHYFKIGYFRSSYNEGGINTILRNLGIPDLYDIFDTPKEEYAFRPNWNTALENVQKSIALLEAKGNYKCIDITPNIFKAPECNSEKEAIEIFEAELKRSGSDCYSNQQGCFSLKEPFEVFGLIPGTNNILAKGQPCTYVIMKGENEWYINALKIVKETIEYVLAQPDKDKYYLHWSS